MSELHPYVIGEVNVGALGLACAGLWASCTCLGEAKCSVRWGHPPPMFVSPGEKQAGTEVVVLKLLCIQTLLRTSGIEKGGHHSSVYPDTVGNQDQSQQCPA